MYLHCVWRILKMWKSQMTCIDWVRAPSWLENVVKYRVKHTFTKMSIFLYVSPSPHLNKLVRERWINPSFQYGVKQANCLWWPSQSKYFVEKSYLITLQAQGWPGFVTNTQRIFNVNILLQLPDTFSSRGWSLVLTEKSGHFSLINWALLKISSTSTISDMHFLT